MAKTRIIIIGGGFGGVKCARTLCRLTRQEDTEIVLFNRENHLVFSPLLAEVVGSSINSLDVVVPLRQLLPRVYCRTEQVRQIDFDRNEIVFGTEGGKAEAMKFDHLVIGSGSATNLNVVPGMADHAFPLKTVGDAARLRSHIMEQMEKAEVTSDPARKRWHLTFLVVGGGYSGVEAAGEVNDLVRSSARYFRNWKVEDVKVLLIHSHEEILPEISPGLRQFARKKMEKAGVEIVLNARVGSATPEGVGVENGPFYKGGTIICTVGNSPAAIVASSNAPKTKGRLATGPDMRVPGHQNVWAVGDCAWIINTQDDKPSPPTGQFAERQGKQCAHNIVRVMRGKPTRPFRFKMLGELCSIGGHSAVADLFGMHLSGFIAWFVWRGVYLFKLPTIGRRLQVGFDWAWLLIFPRDLAHVRTEQTDRVTRAHYGRGDFIFERGQPATNFYVLQNGEVEILRENTGDGSQVVAVLGPGSFFGERALLDNRPRVMSVRARSPVDVLVMGKEVFSQMSASLGPLKDALAKALNRRTVDIWKNEQKLRELLEATGVKQLMDETPQPRVRPDETLAEIGRRFVADGSEFFFVSTDGKALEGVVTITDLLRARSGGSSGTSPVSEFMTRNPVYVTAEDSCAVAANAFREYRLKTLPVLDGQGRIVGSLRLRQLMAFMFQQLGPERQAPSTAVVNGNGSEHRAEAA